MFLLFTENKKYKISVISVFICYQRPITYPYLRKQSFHFLKKFAEYYITNIMFFAEYHKYSIIFLSLYHIKQLFKISEVFVFVITKIR